jgi:hypothetical protein
MELNPDPRDAWRSKVAKEQITQEYITWLSHIKDWRHFLTLTFENPRETEVAYKYFLRLVQILNKEAFGKNYTRIVGHSYFNYVVGMEWQKKRDIPVIHFHVLADSFLDYAKIHEWWELACGWAWIDQIRDVAAATNYVLKYVMKTGEQNIQLFLKANPKGRKPLKVFPWWKDYGKTL